MAMTISAQEVDADPSKMPTLQFNLSAFDGDRRWAFSLPTLGQVVYLEKSGLKYVILWDHKQYAEVADSDLGVSLRRDLTPSAVAGQLKSRARAEMLGVEPVNGRTARKYRLTVSGDEAKSGGAIYIDLETGLAVRMEMNSTQASGKSMRLIVEGRDIQLNPERSLFDVPLGMKKVSAQEIRQQIGIIGSTLRSFAGAIRGAPDSVPPSLPATSNSNASRPRH